MAHRHELKTWPPFFDRLLDGTKTFEIRNEDDHRRFHVGDVLWLREHNGNSYTGRSIHKAVLFVFRWDNEDLGAKFLKEDTVVMALGPSRCSVGGD